MKNIKNCIILTVFGIILLSCFEKTNPVGELTGKIRGRIITENDTYEGMAIITTIPWTKADTLQSDNYFELDDMPKGEYFVFVNIDGYETGRRKAEIEGGGINELTFNMEKIIIVNQPPSRPELLFPNNGTPEMEAPVELVWKGSIDPEGGEVLYDLYFGDHPEPYNLVASNLSDTTYIIEELEERTSYFWKVLAKDEEDDVRESSISRFITKGTINYTYNPPEGKRPLPQHAPTFDENDFNEMMDKLWMASNCGDYLVGDSTKGNELSLSLTFFTENETDIYCTDYGEVRGYFNEGERGISILVEDLSDPSRGWFYQHLIDVNFKYGDLVAQGDLLGKTIFDGTYMYSIGRVVNLGFSWSSRVFGYYSPESLFYLPDDGIPQSVDDICYIRNGSNINGKGEVYPTSIHNKNLFILEDEADIIVNIFDTGQLKDASYDYSPSFDYGLNVKTIDCTITSYKTGEEIQIVYIDFEKLLLTENDLNNLYANHIYYKSKPEEPKNFMIITNVKQVGDSFTCNSGNSFNTRATDAEGNRLYPNGNYGISITFTDFSGNTNERSRSIRISNW